MADDIRRDSVEQTVRRYEQYRSEQHIQAVTDILDGSDDRHRTRALQLLADGEVAPLNISPIFPTVVSLLTDPDPDVRNAAREVIAKLAESCADRERPVPGLSDLLSHENSQIRRDALYGANVAGESRPRVLRDEIPILVDLLSDSKAENRHLAAVVLSHAADAYPDVVAESSEDLIDRIETDDALVKGGAARAIARLSEHRPLAVVDAIPTVHSEIEADLTETGPLVEILGNVAREAPASVLDATPELVDVASTSGTNVTQSADSSSTRVARQNERRLERGATRAKAIEALVEIAKYEPEVVASHAEEVAPLVTADVPAVRESTLELLSVLGTEHPRTVDTVVPHLIDHLVDAPSDSERERVHRILIECSDGAPALFAAGVRRRLDLLVDVLSDDDPGLRGAAAGFLSFVAEHDPGAVADLEETMIRLLDDPSLVVRGNAALVLGVCGSSKAKEAVEGLDPDEQYVADAVERARERLDEVSE